ncbi:hypothetical protein EUA93_10515 [Nocardioides oleivorans]|uniref:Uncharacterized protein n=1 Tax=Nocardioides oleivorans TaxID=273676 RepID=A0A4Q2RZJ3_9ACTN|nr:hypothetical protein [Nocardioides oleivorans]RYB94740.1 hypothetical protein EUA93_10515 [Nocardioides oleivorans]
MGSTMLHICLETEGAPAADGEHEVGERWICECGGNFVYREGFNAARPSFSTMGWWPAPAIPRPRSAIGNLILGPRKG